MSLQNKYKGVIVPMVTPLLADGTIDVDSVKRIVDSFLAAKVCPFILGTTGEAPSIASAERHLLVQTVVERAQGKALVYAGISSTCLNQSIADAVLYHTLGVDVVVATLPAYYPMSDNAMIRYFTQLADAIPCELIIYNMPATVKMSIPLTVLSALSTHSNIVGMKDSERDMDRLNDALAMWRDRSDFVHLIGWAAQSAYALTHGSSGIVPSTGNICPALYADLYKAAVEGNSERLDELQEKTDLISSFYQKGRSLSESIPALKVIMSVLGLCSPAVAVPMYEMDRKEEDEFKVIVKKKMIKLNFNIEQDGQSN